MAASDTPGLVLRRAGPGDAALVLQADVFDGPAEAGSVARYLGTDAPDPRNLLLLAELDGRVVGFASATVLDHPDKPPGLYINELGVNETAQRRGIARALLHAIRAEGRARGCTVSYVLTEADNTAACGLYRSAGGDETGGIVMFEWPEAP